MQDTMERFQGIYSEKVGREKLWIYSDHFSASLGMPAANLLDEKWRAWMKEVLLKHGVKLWVLDNIGAVTPGLDENSREGWSPINRWLLDLRFAGISTILIHHEGKGGEQRGTSAREDNLDISISLKRPKDYHPEDGARFICKFEKARIRQQDLHLITDTEFQMQQDPDGKTIWTWANVKQENKAKVLKMLSDGVASKDIAAGLGITAARVSQVKKEVLKDGLITEAGKLTQTGFEWLQNN
jgi:putative DNA primase/helicase